MYLIVWKNVVFEEKCKSFSQKLICQYQIKNHWAIPASSWCLSFYICKTKSLEWMICKKTFILQNLCYLILFHLRHHLCKTQV